MWLSLTPGSDCYVLNWCMSGEKGGDHGHLFLSFCVCDELLVDKETVFAHFKKNSVNYTYFFYFSLCALTTCKFVDLAQHL